MAFENVGFTRPVNQNTSGKAFAIRVHTNLKYAQGNLLPF